MQWWALMLLLVAVKVPIAVLLVWIPLRSDDAMSAHADVGQEPGSGEDDGGSKTLPQEPRGPHPRRPAPIGPRRRGPHGSPAPPSPPRIRHGRERVAARAARR